MHKKSTQKKYIPIAALPLINDAWVFFIFGWIVSAILERYESIGASTDKIESLIFEPYSIGAFFIISAVGFISVLFTVFLLEYFYKKTIEQIRESFLLKRFLIPISEVGLSTGAIIIGASFGIAFNYATLASWNDQHDITKSTIAIAMTVILISWPWV